MSNSLEGMQAEVAKRKGLEPLNCPSCGEQGYTDPEECSYCQSDRSDGWAVHPASALEAGDWFIFSHDIGGEGDCLVVESVTNNLGTISIETKSLDFTIDVTSTQLLKMKEQG